MPGLDHFRAEQRRRVNLTAQISAPNSRQRIQCVLLDLSLGGAKVRCPAGFEVGDETELTLTTSSLWEPLTIPTLVAWARLEPEGRLAMGLKFQPTSGMQLLVLAELLRDHDRY